MKIGDLASAAGCDVQTVRYYEREGLLHAPERDVSGYRRYEEQHLAQLRFIRHCRALDISLAEVRHLQTFARAPRRSCAAVNDLLDEHIKQVRDRMSALRNLERHLVELRRQCKGADDNRSCAIIEAFMNGPASVAQSEPRAMPVSRVSKPAATRRQLDRS